MSPADNQKMRLTFALFLGPVVAFWLPLMLAATTVSVMPYYNIESALPFRIAAISGMSTFACVYGIWYRGMLRKESRVRGFYLGLMAGAGSFFVAAVWLSFHMFGLSFIVDSPLVIAFGLGAGGFLALPAGGFLGWLFSRNPQEPDYS